MAGVKISFAFLFGVIAMATSQSCFKRFVGGEWISHGDCVSQETKLEILRDLKNRADEEQKFQELKRQREKANEAERTTAPVSITPLVVPPGWEKSGNLYYKCFTDVRVNYATAKSNCAAAFVGARLAAKVLRDPAAVGNIISRGYIGDNWTTGEAPWVGFDDLSDEGDWEWVDGGNMNPITTEWSAGSPSNSGNEDCGHIIQVIDERLAINDNACSYPLHYICEMEIGI